MIQSTLQKTDGLSVGIIMDGNGRWARERRLPRTRGHREGALAVRRVVERAAQPAVGIDVLTLYAFSSDNWGRPAAEVGSLMRLFGRYLREEREPCRENGIRLSVVGRRDRLPAPVARAVHAAEEATAAGTALHLRVAIDYSARDAIVAAAVAARACDGGALDRDRFAALLGEVEGGGSPARDLDLLIRTGGERRLSDFMLWECAYAELYFTSTLWPDFGAAELDAALADFRGRERRFGRVLEEAS